MAQFLAAYTPDELNVVDPANLIEPATLYRKLQTSHPVYWCEPARAWFLTRHEDVARAFRDPRLSNVRIDNMVSQRLGGNVDVAKDYSRVVREMMHNKDAAAHLRLRKQANQGFTAALLESWNPTIYMVVNELLDAIQPHGRVELVKEVAGPMPSRMMAEILAIPLRDQPRFQSWADPITDFFGAPLGDAQQSARRANTAVLELEAYFLELIEERRNNPGEDLLSHLMRYDQDGKMNPGELVSSLSVILIAGHTTTIDQLSNGVYDLLTHPEQFALLRERPELLESAVEEMLRFSPSLPFIYRVITEDMEIGGQLLKNGQVVFLGLGAGNRDPSIFPDPDRFDITRATTTKNLAFGYGPHLCLGRLLARRELEVAIELLLRRMPALAIDPGHTPRRKMDSLVFRGFHSLHLTF